jgi:hypothetical protein
MISVYINDNYFASQVTKLDIVYVAGKAKKTIFAFVYIYR